MDIYRLPALSDNYIFVLHDRQRQIAAVVDPAEPGPVLDCLTELKASLIAIFNTHHHGDHVGANQALLRRYPDANVYGGAVDRGRIPGQTRFLEEGDSVTFGERRGMVYFVPGHTRAHIAYYFPPETDHSTAVGELFCGDTLFAGGCGRLFEGTPSQMVESLTKLRQLPDQTRVWCAHEYTLGNLNFARTVDPDNVTLQARWENVRAARAQQQATVPSLLGEEKQTNPFLRWDADALRRTTGYQDAADVFRKIRGMKDHL